MAVYTNSPLATCAVYSPNHSGQRTHAIDRITPHCVVGQLDAKSIGAIFEPVSRQASSNYGIGKGGEIGLYVEEKNRSWCSSSNANDQRAVTIECASDTTDPYAMNSFVYTSLVNLCADICKRNGKKKLLWIPDKDRALAYEPAADEMLLTVHRWFAAKSCPGDWLFNRLGDLAERVTRILNPTAAAYVPTAPSASSGIPGDGNAPHEWAQNEVEWAIRAGVLRGSGNGTGYRLNEPITREEAIVMLARAMGAVQ